MLQWLRRRQGAQRLAQADAEALTWRRGLWGGSPARRSSTGDSIRRRAADADHGQTELGKPAKQERRHSSSLKYDATTTFVSRSANQIPPVLRRSAPDIARQSQSAKFRFPDPRDGEAGASVFVERLSASSAARSSVVRLIAVAKARS